MTVLFVYSIILTFVWVVLGAYLLWGMSQLKQLKDQPLATVQPSVAIIIAVRNEEDDLEKALQSVCNLRYDNHRIVVINDRSTDRTAEILAKFNHPKLSVTTIDTLPTGWLGKNNALYQGYLNSNEEWLLFTDADIEYHPDALSRAFGYVEKRNLDHLTIFADVQSRSTLLKSVLSTFGMMLLSLTRPWDAIKPKRSGAIGIGAFNLVKRSAYEKAGTHVKIKLRPDDDLMLGRNIKAAGSRQDALVGQQYLCLEWYRSLTQFINGLLKNSFPVTNYSILRVIADSMNTLASFVLPLPLMFIFGDTSIRLMACAIALAQLIFMTVNKASKWWHMLMMPFAGCLMVYIMIRGAYVTLKQGGIYWRDTFYSLDELKKG